MLRASLFTTLWLLSLMFCLDISAQEHQFSVKETRITRDDYIDAYQHRFEYNQVRDTTLDWHTKKEIEVAAFRTLTDEEKEAYIWTDYGILNIGRCMSAMSMTPVLPMETLTSRPYARPSRTKRPNCSSSVHRPKPTLPS